MWDTEDISMLLVLLLAVALLIGSLLVMVGGFSAVLEKQRCGSLSVLTDGYEFQWGLWTGCLVKMPNGFWVNVNEAGYILLEQVVVPE